MMPTLSLSPAALRRLIDGPVNPEAILAARAARSPGLDLDRLLGKRLAIPERDLLDQDLSEATQPGHSAIG